MNVMKVKNYVNRSLLLYHRPRKIVIGKQKKKTITLLWSLLSAALFLSFKSTNIIKFRKTCKYELMVTVKMCTKLFISGNYTFGMHVYFYYFRKIKQDCKKMEFYVMKQTKPNNKQLNYLKIDVDIIIIIVDFTVITKKNLKQFNLLY